MDENLHARSLLCAYDKQWLTFSQQIVDLAQFKAARIFHTGSRAEVKYNEISIKRFCPNIESDLDFMFYSTQQYAFPRTQRVPDAYRGEVLRYVTNGQHAGYVRL